MDCREDWEHLQARQGVASTCAERCAREVRPGASQPETAAARRGWGPAAAAATWRQLAASAPVGELQALDGTGGAGVAVHVGGGAQHALLLPQAGGGHDAVGAQGSEGEEGVGAGAALGPITAPSQQLPLPVTSLPPARSPEESPVGPSPAPTTPCAVWDSPAATCSPVRVCGVAACCLAAVAGLAQAQDDRPRVARNLYQRLVTRLHIILVCGGSRVRRAQRRKGEIRRTRFRRGKEG